MAAENRAPREYSGQCHCGSVRFEFRSEPITAGCRCNCSICRRRGATMSPVYIEPTDVLELEGTESLTVYRFGDHLVNHYFCSICGTYTFHEPVNMPGTYRFNLGCIDAIDTGSLAIESIDGRSF
jgi:hypothetical protein